MSKFGIGVGEDFPLDEGREDNSRHGHRGRFRHHHHRHGHMHRHGHPHMHHHGRGHRHGLVNLPLIAVVATLAALIGAGKIPAIATDVILAVAGILVALSIALHIWAHRRFHAKEVS